MLKFQIALGLICIMILPVTAFGQNCFDYTITGVSYEIAVSEAIINGLRIDVGDEIGVFDDDLCVGASAYSGSFPANISAWQQDSGYPGFIPGHPMLFKICDASSEQDTLEAVPYIEVGDGTFGAEVYAVVALAIGEVPLRDVDHNGSINSQDAAWITLSILDQRDLGPLEAISADMNGDNQITIEDLVQVIDAIPDR